MAHPHQQVIRLVNVVIKYYHWLHPRQQVFRIVNVVIEYHHWHHFRPKVIRIANVVIKFSGLNIAQLGNYFKLVELFKFFGSRERKVYPPRGYFII